MANILNLITIGEKKYYVVDGNPASGGGTPAELGSIAVYDNGSVGYAYLKTGNSDTAWDQISTSGTSGIINSGVAGRLALYPSSGNTIDDVFVQNSQNIDIAVESQGSRSAAIEYRIPNPGNAITAADFILSEGAQTKNGNMTFSNNVTIGGDLTVNGSLTSLNTTNTTVFDKLISLNVGGGASSAGGSGIEIAESVQATSTSAGANAGSIFTATAIGALGNGIVVTVTDSGGPGAVSVVEGVGTVSIDLNGNAPVSQATLASAGLTLVTLNGVGLIAPEVFPATSGGTGTITGYIKMAADRNGYELKVSNVAYKNDLDLSNLSADRVQKFANTSGTFVMRPDGTPGVAGQIAYYNDANNLTNSSGLTFAAGVLTATNVTVSSLGAGVVHSSAGGVLSSSAVALGSEVSGVLPIANGGTNSSTALNNNRLMYSSGGAIVEYSALSAGQLYYGAASTGLPAQSSKLYFDSVNNYLQVGSSTMIVPNSGTGCAQIGIQSNEPTGGSATLLLETATNGAGTIGGLIQSRMSNGTIASPTASATNDSIFFLGAFGYGATGYSAGSKAHMAIVAAENWTDTAQGTFFDFRTTKIGTTTKKRVAQFSDDGALKIFGQTNNTQAVAIYATAATANYSLVLPAAQGSANTFLKNNGSGTLSWSGITLTTDVTGILPLANGGTNANLTAVAGGIVYSGASAMAISAAGTAGQALLSGGAGAPTWFSSTGVVKATAGVLSAGTVSLTSEVSGVLPIANGGTNSSTALNNNRIMVSSSGAIVEHSALTAGSVFFANANGLPGQDNSNFFWDSANTRLGLGTASPARLLDVNGSSIFRGALRLASAAATNANFEAFQAQVSTTDATVTTLASVTIPTDSAVMIEARITGRRTGGSAGSAQDAASYVRTARFKNVGGVVSIINLQSDYTSEDQNSWNATMDVSGTSARMRVNGAANNNVDWTVTYFVISL